ncbi:Replicase polyprotein 1ab, partial [Dissostichus eleginoides]
PVAASQVTWDTENSFSHEPHRLCGPHTVAASGLGEGMYTCYPVTIGVAVWMRQLKTYSAVGLEAVPSDRVWGKTCTGKPM